MFTSSSSCHSSLGLSSKGGSPSSILGLHARRRKLETRWPNWVANPPTCTPKPNNALGTWMSQRPRRSTQRNPIDAQIDIANNVTFSWDGEEIGVDMPKDFERIYPNYNIFGLLGTYNNNTADDFMSPTGEIKDTAIEFGSSWVVPGSCSASHSDKRGIIVHRKLKESTSNNP